MPLPPYFPNVNPESIVICVYPPGLLRDSKASIALTVVDTSERSKYDTVLNVEIPISMANFKVPVEIEFRYVKGKFKYGSEYCDYVSLV